MSREIIYRLVFIDLILLVYQIQYCSGCERISINNAVYVEKKDKYKCIHDNQYMFGDNTLTCQENGSWEGEIPYCAVPIPIELLHDSQNQMNIIESGKCATSGKQDIWLVRTMGKQFSIIRMIFKASSAKCITPKVTFQVHNKYEKSENFICANKSTEITYKFMEIINEDIEFYLDGTNWHKFSLCSIQVYSKPEELCSISSINIPNGYFSPKNAKVLKYGNHITFHCNEGFRLHGNHHFYCGLKNKSVGECQRVQCMQPPMRVLNGIWENWNHTETYVFEDELHLNCKSGYELNGTGTIKCLKNGKWSITSMTCLKRGFPITLAIAIVISVTAVLVTLLIGIFVMIIKRKGRDKSDEETNSENIYYEVNDIDNEDPPPLPLPMKNSKTNHLVLSTDISHEERFRRELMNIENRSNMKIATKMTNSNDRIDVKNDLYSSD